MAGCNSWTPVRGTRWARIRWGGRRQRPRGARRHCSNWSARKTTCRIIGSSWASLRHRLAATATLITRLPAPMSLTGFPTCCALLRSCPALWRHRASGEPGAGVDIVAPGDPWVKLTDGWAAISQSRFDQAVTAAQHARFLALRSRRDDPQGACIARPELGGRSSRPPNQASGRAAFG